MQLDVTYLHNVNRNTRMEDISVVLDKTERHMIQQLPWPEFSYKPRVSFSIAHAEDCILLKYFVQEKAIRIEYYADNSPVHEDSCVEFFISFNQESEYYNLEFNCEGTCLLGFGKSLLQRELIREDIIRKIRRQPAIKTNPEEKDNSINWELTLVIPFDVFVYHELLSLRNRYCKVNFYKCGDKLPEPHFLSWHNISALVPDFHLPEFFGEAHFK